MSKCVLRVSPMYQAMLTALMAVSAPRSYRIHWPSPYADQRVAGLLSSVFCGMLASFPLVAVAATAGVGGAVARTARSGVLVHRGSSVGPRHWTPRPAR